MPTLATQKSSKNVTNPQTVTVAICGNPNCGKSTLFNAMTGLRQRVANYPGVTVEKISGRFHVEGDSGPTYTLVDIPGTYSLAANSPDEYIAAGALFGSIGEATQPDVIISVIDSTNIERGLYLLFQASQIGCPIVVALNMVDIAKREGIECNYEKLSQLLGGIPVIPVVATRGTGVPQLKLAVAQALKRGTVPVLKAYDPSVERVCADLMHATQNGFRTKAEYFRILFDDHGPASKTFLIASGEHGRIVLEKGRATLADKVGSLALAETRGLTERAALVASQVIDRQHVEKTSSSEKIDRVLLHPIFGPLFLFALMTLMFQSIFTWAEPLMSGIDSLFGSLSGYTESFMTEGPLRSLITDGLIGGVGSVLIFLPQIVILFLFISILEDSGYMPRAALLVDRMFGWCGLSGKSFIPMLSSFACAIPGIMATRTIEDKHIRFLTIMVAPLMSCSARLPVYTIMIAAFIPQKTYWGVFNSQGMILLTLYLLGLVVAVLIAFVVKKFMYKPQRGSFMMEMPSYKWPRPSSIGLRVMTRAQAFLTRAGTIILAITILIWALSYYPHSETIGESFDQKRIETINTTSTKTEFLQSDIDRLIAPSSPEQIVISNNLQLRLAELTDAESIEALRTQTLSHDSTESDTTSHDSIFYLASEKRLLEVTQQTKIAELNQEEAGAYLRDSYFGRAGKAIEPFFEPLGWDWRITMAALASFPAREVIIATLGAIYNLGSDVDEGSASLTDKLRQARWADGDKAGQTVFSPAVALSVMVFFALCCQCGATIVTIKQETGKWKYAVIAFTYMTVLAYFGAMAVYQFTHWVVS